MQICPPSAVVEVPDPTPEMAMHAALIMYLSKGCPKRAERIVGKLHGYLEAMHAIQPAIRIRSARFDIRAQYSLRASQLWLERARPVIRVLVKP